MISTKRRLIAHQSYFATGHATTMKKIYINHHFIIFLTSATHSKYWTKKNWSWKHFFKDDYRLSWNTFQGEVFGSVSSPRGTQSYSKVVTLWHCDGFGEVFYGLRENLILLLIYYICNHFCFIYLFYISLIFWWLWLFAISFAVPWFGAKDWRDLVGQARKVYFW